MKEAYCRHFGIDGEVLYFTSQIKPKNMEIREKNTFAFLGSFEYGRWKSLVDIGNTLNRIDKDLFVDIYGCTNDQEILTAFNQCKGVRFHGRVSYSNVIDIMNSVEFVVHVEDFDEKSKQYTRFSLSTKIADCLSCGACTFAYGPSDVGSMDYLIKTNSAIICSDPLNLFQVLEQALTDSEQVKKTISRANIVAKKNHSVIENQKRMKTIVEQVIVAKLK